MNWTIVIPSLCRPTAGALLDSLATAGDQAASLPQEVIVVDDRREPCESIDLGGERWSRSWLSERLTIVRSGGRGPAAARNIGWRAAHASCDWVVFLDDDVEVTPTWIGDLMHDLAGAAEEVVAVQGRITVPLPDDRRPNDCERNTAGLETASWITADMAARIPALRRVGGFDERFPRAFREDADLALRLQAIGGRMAVGGRRTIHPARAGNWTLSVRQQRGNADDVLMTRLHGRDWYRRAAAPRGRRPVHVLTVLTAGAALLAMALGRRRAAACAAAAWAALTGQFAWLRIAPGPRDRAEVARMIATSVLIPPAAVRHWLRALLTLPRTPAPWPTARLYDALLVDRDGTIVVDVPYNGDPAKVTPVPGARAALDRARAAGLRIGVISNQSGIARGIVSAEQVAAVNARIEEMLGPFDTWRICPHGDADRCPCRKPQPGLVTSAAETLGLDASRCVVIGDIGSDVDAATAAGAAAVLVPTATTRAEEVAVAPHVADSFEAAVDAILTGRLPGPRRAEQAGDRAPDRTGAAA